MRSDARRNRAAILAAAEAVFVERGPAAATDEVASRAGVAIGTVFRHFPTKADLLRAIMKDLLQRLSHQASALVEDGDPATALFDLFTSIVDEAAGKRTVVQLLADSGLAVSIAEPVAGFRADLERLLIRAQHVGAVRSDVRITEVAALLTSSCQGAMHGQWDPVLQQRVLTVIFAGLRPPNP